MKELPSLSTFFRNLQAYTVLALVNTFQFHGRASRREFWYFFTAIVLAQFVVVTLFRGPNMATASTYLELATLAPFATVQMRRLHDQNITGIFAYVTVFNFALRLFWGDYALFGGTTFETIAYNNVRLVLDIIDFGLLIFCAFAGDTGENDYGPPSGF